MQISKTNYEEELRPKGLSKTLMRILALNLFVSQKHFGKCHLQIWKLNYLWDIFIRQYKKVKVYGV